MWDIGSTDSQYPPVQKMWDIGSTNFQYPPVRKTWDIEKQYSQYATVWKYYQTWELSKPAYNVKISPSTSGSLRNMQCLGLQNCPWTLTAMQSSVLEFCIPLDCIYPRIPQKKGQSWPKIQEYNNIHTPAGTESMFVGIDNGRNVRGRNERMKQSEETR